MLRKPKISKIGMRNKITEGGRKVPSCPPFPGTHAPQVFPKHSQFIVLPRKIIYTGVNLQMTMIFLWVHHFSTLK